MIVYAARRFFRRIGISEKLSRILDGGDGEKRVARALQTRLRLGDIVWDVGANEGTYSRMIQSMVGEKGKVYAFEPHFPTYKKLKDSLDFDNVSCLNLALSDYSGTGFLSDQPHSANNFLVSGGG